MSSVLKRSIPMLLIVVFVTGIFLLETKLSRAQPAKNSWAEVQVISYSSGLTGFFDKASGKLYVYDSNLEQLVAVRQIEELGKPLKKIK